MDIAEGHLKALEYLLIIPSISVNVNLGSGKGTSVLELIQTFENTNKVKNTIYFAPRRIGDKGFLVADNSFAKKLLIGSLKKFKEYVCRWMELLIKKLNKLLIS